MTGSYVPHGADAADSSDSVQTAFKKITDPVLWSRWKTSALDRLQSAASATKWKTNVI